MSPWQAGSNEDIKMNYQIIKLTDRPALKEQAALWFHEKSAVQTAYGLSYLNSGQWRT